MSAKPERYQHQHCLHFVTFSCYRRMRLLDSAAVCNVFERELERVRRWYGCYISGYVVMPEHVHLLISEPERGKLSVAMQMLKQITSRKLRLPGVRRFWQVRYYDFPVWSKKKRIEKLRYMPATQWCGDWSRFRKIGNGAASSTMRPELRVWSKSSRSGRRGAGNSWGF